LTVAEFCRREGVSAPSFYQWRRRLFNTSAGQRSAGTQERETASAFQPVLLAGAGVVTIAWPSGVRMELPAHQASLVQMVVAELARSESRRAAGDA
jgi:transposase-like protein